MIPPKTGKLYKLLESRDFYRTADLGGYLSGNSKDGRPGFIERDSILLVVRSIRRHRSSSDKDWTIQAICGEEIGYVWLHWNWERDLVLYEEE